MKLLIKKIHIICFYLIVFFPNNITLCNKLGLYQAIQTALKYNETILYNAKLNYLSSNSQLRLAEAEYKTQINFSVNLNNSYSYSLDPDAIESYSNITSSDIELSQRFLMPLGGKLDFVLDHQVQMNGSASFYSSPRFHFIYNQPLDLAGIESGHYNIISARKSHSLSRISLLLKKEELILLVIDSYFRVWQLYKEVEQRTLDFASANRMLEIAELRLKGGQISEFEVMNIQVQQKLSEDELKVSQNELKSQKIFLLRLLGQNLNRDIQLIEEIDIDPVQFDLESAIKTAFQNRLEIQQSKINLELSDLRLKQAISSSYPKLNITGNYAFYSFSDNTLGAALSNFPNRSWYLLSTVSFPIIDGGLRSNEVQIEKYDYENQREYIKLLHEEIAIEIENYLRSLQVHLQRIKSLTLNLNIAKETLNISEIRFKQGQISSTEVENIRQRFMTAQFSLNNAKISYITQSAYLAKAMGVLDNWVKRLCY